MFVANTSATKGKILITGAIGDYGTTVSQDANGKPDPNGNFEKVTLKQGGFVVNGTALTKMAVPSRRSIRPIARSCCRAPAPSPSRNGTGAYAGITGKVTITFTFDAVARRNARMVPEAEPCQ